MYLFFQTAHLSSTLQQLALGIGSHSFTVSSPWEECCSVSAAEAIHTVPIFVPPGTHYCLVDTGGVVTHTALINQTGYPQSRI